MNNETQGVVDELRTLNRTVDHGFDAVWLMMVILICVTMCSS
jgi:hypothetical protein